MIDIINIDDFLEFNFDELSSLESPNRKDLSENTIQNQTSNNYINLEFFKINKVAISYDNNEINMVLETNKVVKPVAVSDFTFKIYDCSENINTSIPTPLPPTPSKPPVVVPPKTYLFSGINPVNNEIEIWYDTNINSKGPGGKIYLQVGLVENDTSSL